MKTKILIVGIGGVGGYYGGLLAKKYADNDLIDIYFLSRGRNLEQIKSTGLKVITEKESFICHPTLATDSPEEIGTVDYVLVATKSYDLEETIHQIKPCLNSQTVILPLLNGANISDRVKALLPNNEIWSGCVYIVGRLNEPGVVESSGGVHDLFFGLQNTNSDRLKFMEDVFINAGIETTLSENIDMIIWRKFIFISATASLTSYFNVGFRDLLTTPERKEFTIDLINEVYNVALAKGISFNFDVLKSTIEHIERIPFGKTSSMHSDFLAHHTTEIESLTGIVLRLAHDYTIDVPNYELVYNTLKERCILKS